VRDAGGLGAGDGGVGRLAASNRDEQPRAERVGGAGGVEDDV
jgi:hypothetical protein